MPDPPSSPLSLPPLSAKAILASANRLTYTSPRHLPFLRTLSPPSTPHATPPPPFTAVLSSSCSHHPQVPPLPTLEAAHPPTHAGHIFCCDVRHVAHQLERALLTVLRVLARVRQGLAFDEDEESDALVNLKRTSITVDGGTGGIKSPVEILPSSTIKAAKLHRRRRQEDYKKTIKRSSLHITSTSGVPPAASIPGLGPHASPRVRVDGQRGAECWEEVGGAAEGRDVSVNSLPFVFSFNACARAFSHAHSLLFSAAIPVRLHLPHFDRRVAHANVRTCIIDSLKRPEVRLSAHFGRLQLDLRCACLPVRDFDLAPCPLLRLDHLQPPFAATLFPLHVPTTVLPERAVSARRRCGRRPWQRAHPRNQRLRARPRVPVSAPTPTPKQSRSLRLLNDDKWNW